MHCPNCTFDIPDGSKFCLNCGSNLSGLSGDEPHAAVTPPRGAVRDGSESADMPQRQAPPVWGASIGDRKTIGGVLDSSARHPESLPQMPLSERYEVLSEVGRGGFGIVFRARDKKLDRIVAVKRLLAQQLSGAQRVVTLERFEREARAIAGLNHRHIVQVFDHDQDAEGHYIVMEYVSGGTLAAYLRDHKRLPVDEALDLVKGVCQGLGFAHRRNLVHRDIKPANILLGDDEGRLVAKIVDFGLARQGGGSEVSISGYGLGTPWYMPPEQRRDAKNVNHTADVYALGKTLYEMVTGEIPDNVDPELIPPPPVLSRVILKCLKGNPEDRYFSMEELLSDLERVQSGASTAAPVALPAGQAQARNVCPTCNTANGDDVKFCEQCGTGLYRSCPECDRENSIHKKFCGSCGTEVEGFALVAGILEKIEQYRQEKRWSRVLKEADLVPAKVQLPKEKGRQSLQAIAKLQEDARSTIALCEETQALIHRACEEQEFEKALELVTQYREADPHNTGINELLDRLPQDIARRKDERAWQQAQSAVARHLQEGEFEPADGALKQYLSRFPKGEFADRALAEARRVRDAQLKSSMKQVIAKEDAKRLRELIEQYRHELGTDADVERWSNSLAEWEDDWAWKATRNVVLEKSCNFDDAGALTSAAETIRQFLTTHEWSRHADEARAEWERLVRMELHRRLDAAVKARDPAQVEQVAADAHRLIGSDPQIEAVAHDLPKLMAEWDWEATVAEAEELISVDDRSAAAAEFSRFVELYPRDPHRSEALRRMNQLQRDDVRIRLNAAIKARDADEADRIVDEWRSRFGRADDIEQFAASLPQRRDAWNWERTQQQVTELLKDQQDGQRPAGTAPVTPETLDAAIAVVQDYCANHTESAHLPAAAAEMERLRRDRLLLRLRRAAGNGAFADAYRLAAECAQKSIEAPEVDRALRQIPEQIVDELLAPPSDQGGRLVEWHRQALRPAKEQPSESVESPGDVMLAMLQASMRANEHKQSQQHPATAAQVFQSIRESVEHFLAGDRNVPCDDIISGAVRMLRIRFVKNCIDERIRAGVDQSSISRLLDHLFNAPVCQEQLWKGAHHLRSSASRKVGLPSLKITEASVTAFVEHARQDRIDFRRELGLAALHCHGSDQRSKDAANSLRSYLAAHDLGAYVSEARQLVRLLKGDGDRAALTALQAELNKEVREALLYLHAFECCRSNLSPRRAEEHVQMARQIRDAFVRTSAQFQAIDRVIRRFAGDAAADVVDQRKLDKSEFRAAVHKMAEKANAYSSTVKPLQDYLTQFPTGRYATEARAYVVNHGGIAPAAAPAPPPPPKPGKPAAPSVANSDSGIKLNSDSGINLKSDSGIDLRSDSGIDLTSDSGIELTLEDQNSPDDSSEFELVLDDGPDIFETDFEIPPMDDEFVLSLDDGLYVSAQAWETDIYIELAEICQKKQQLPRAREHLASAEAILKKLPAKDFDRETLKQRLDEVRRKVK